MSIGSLEASLARLDRAVSRLERGVAGGEQARLVQDRAFSRLDSRHDSLRTRVAETIARLDGLIAEKAQTADEVAG